MYDFKLETKMCVPFFKPGHHMNLHRNASYPAVNQNVLTKTSNFKLIPKQIQFPYLRKKEIIIIKKEKKKTNVTKNNIKVN